MKEYFDPVFVASKPLNFDFKNFVDISATISQNNKNYF